MSKLYICPVCGKSHLETRFTMKVTTDNILEFNDKGYWVTDRRHDIENYTGEVDHEYGITCEYCGSTFGKEIFIVEDE